MDLIFICRCEEVDLEHIKQTVSEYKCSAREIKLRTRAGMGYCGGRICRAAIETIREEMTGETSHHENTLKVQPPVRPVTVSILGGHAHD